MVTALYRNSRGVLYVGTAWGLCRHVPDKDNFMPIPQVGNQAYISDIVEDSRGAMWFGSNNMGLFRYDSENGWHNFRYSASGSGGLPNDNVTTLFEDLDHRLWVGTEAGLCVFDPDSESFEAFDPDNTILSGQTICSVERDWRGYMWVSSSMGLSCIDVDRGLLINHFTQIDGLPTNQFNYRSSLKARDGKLYFGSISGLIEFYPGRFQTNNFVPPVLISGIQVNNRELRPGPPPDGLPGLEKTSFATDKIKLRSGQNTVAFDFAALSYQSPDKNMYACKLEGWDDDWTHEKQPRAVYSNLSPGKYTFMVRGANNDGVWSEPGASVSVTVLHPFYSSTSARIIYLLLVLAALYTTHVVITARQTRRMKEYAARKEREGNRFKIEFFTNLVHEIRTPLSLINLPLELIIKSGDGNPVTRGWLDTMNRNTQSLLNLVNQLLDLRKNEQAHYSLDAAPCNVSELTREVCSSFRAMAQIRGVALEVTTPQSPCIANVDGDAISKVVTNLLSNALKYATYRVGVHLRPVSGGGFSISVMDDGPGIDPTERKRIFEPFFQSWGGKAGTGIGLSLAMLLARKHSGSIRIEDTPMGGATFILEIPPLEDDFARSVPLHGYVVDYAASLPGSRPAAAADASGENTVLVVEDNRELRELIGSFLGRDYRVLTADNGRQAVKVLLSEQINIVVSDVMMPEMDGWQLCDFIKTDNCLCHIPVVQLTARTSHEDRLKGLELGADAYIEKPFSLEHLSAQILNLLENRRRLRESYGLSPDTGDAVMVATNKRDSQFIEKLNAEILKHIDRENFYIETLAESMFMSRSNFYRKIKSLFGMSPNRYLKDFRIRHAAKLLSDNSFDANDVYDRVGFSSPSYFSKCFRERFDVSPRDYAMNVSSKAL
jgi:signal transduction histidine kinase/DNA-binding response OmpR family regulator